MSIRAYLENNQPLIHKSFTQAIKNDRVPHAYLISGSLGAPLLETAIFLAKSLLCDRPNPLADEECLTCQRIDHGNFNDLLILDGEGGSIKKEEVKEIVGDFSKTPLESKNKLIYIINLVENMTVEAVNSLLKFLEEPNKNTFAILTTENEAKVLPTIISRCEILRMRLAPRDNVVYEAIELGVSKEDAELLSFFSNSAELILEESEDDNYLKAKAAFLATLNALGIEKSEAIFKIEKEVLPSLGGKAKTVEGRSSKPSSLYYIEMLSIAFKDILSAKGNGPINLSEYDRIIKPLADTLPHIEDSLLEIMKARGLLDLNINPQLLAEHLAMYILEE